MQTLSWGKLQCRSWRKPWALYTWWLKGGDERMVLVCVWSLLIFFLQSVPSFSCESVECHLRICGQKIFLWLWIHNLSFAPVFLAKLCFLTYTDHYVGYFSQLLSVLSLHPQIPIFLTFYIFLANTCSLMHNLFDTLYISHWSEAQRCLEVKTSKINFKQNTMFSNIYKIT